MDMQTLVHGPKDFGVTLKYTELAKPLTKSFYTRIERDAFVEGLKLASEFIGALEITLHDSDSN